MKGELYLMTDCEIYETNKCMRDEGFTERERAEKLGITVSKLRQIVSVISNTYRNEKILYAKQLKDRGYSTAYIADKMNLNHSSVRTLLKQTYKIEKENTK